MKFKMSSESARLICKTTAELLNGFEREKKCEACKGSEGCGIVTKICHENIFIYTLNARRR